MRPNQQETANLVTFTEEILDEKLFLQRLLKIILTLRVSRSLHKIRESTGFHWPVFSRIMENAG